MLNLVEPMNKVTIACNYTFQILHSILTFLNPEVSVYMFD